MLLAHTIERARQTARHDREKALDRLGMGQAVLADVLTICVKDRAMDRETLPQR